MDAVNDFLIYIDGFLGSAIWFPTFLLATGIFSRYTSGSRRFVTSGMRSVSPRENLTRKGRRATPPTSKPLRPRFGHCGYRQHRRRSSCFAPWRSRRLVLDVDDRFLGMTSKFVEVTLSHKYRNETADGTMAGGPMYYMEKGLNAKWLAVVFAVATVLSSFGTGNLPQINSIASGLESTFDLDPLITASVLSVLLALVIIGGITRIAKVAAAIVPTMAMIYLIGAFAVIIPNIGNIIPSFLSIFSNAFSGSAAAAVPRCVICVCIRPGCKSRAVFQ